MAVYSESDSVVALVFYLWTFVWDVPLTPSPMPGLAGYWPSTLPGSAGPAGSSAGKMAQFVNWPNKTKMA
jgi:hypothetical protein